MQPIYANCCYGVDLHRNLTLGLALERSSRPRNLPAFLMVLVLSLLFCSVAHAESQEVLGEFLFGPSMSVEDACNAAEQKAKQEALRRVLGERFSVSEQLSCREGRSQTDDTDCVYNTFLWSEIDGDIKLARRLGDPDVKQTIGASSCRVRMQVVVDVPATKPDPGFDFEVSLSAIRLRAKESVSFTVKPSSTMHLAIFGWSPLHDKKTVTKVFPNQFDSSGTLRQRELQRIPSERMSSQYSFEVSFPKDVKQDFVDEYLIFVGTKSPVTWLDNYDFEQFKARLREVSPSDKRVVKHSYRVIR